MSCPKIRSLICGALLAACMPVLAQQADAPITQQTVEKLIQRLAAAEARIKELEDRLGPQVGQPAPPAAAPAPELPPPEEPHDHMDMAAGGPALKIRGFLDLNLGFGTDANALIFPLGAPVHTTFQSGEFDLFMSSRLSGKISFLDEVVIGSDATNYWGLDIERLQLTYKVNPYFEISGAYSNPKMIMRSLPVPVLDDPDEG